MYCQQYHFVSDDQMLAQLVEWYWYVLNALLLKWTVTRRVLLDSDFSG